MDRVQESARYSPHALQIVLPSPSRRQSGVFFVPQFAHSCATGAGADADAIGVSSASASSVSSCPAVLGTKDGMLSGDGARVGGTLGAADVGAGGLEKAPGNRPMAVSGVVNGPGSS
jgi:hypothetical protein